MGEVVKLKRPRKGTIRGAAREMLTNAMNTVERPAAIIMVALSADGRFAVRMCNHSNDIRDFDAYSRASASIDMQARRLIEGD